MKNSDNKPTGLRPKKRWTQAPFHGHAPKKLTKGLRRHLAKVERQNKIEADDQRAIVGR